jgi:hypothetical protein
MVFKLCGIPNPSNSRNGIDIDFDSKIELELSLDNKIHPVICQDLYILSAM